MSDNYVGEIILFAGNYAPVDWVQCNGQLLSINDYPALYFLLGTTYGGDGVSTFGVPDLRLRVPIGQGQGPAPLSNRTLGQQVGSLAASITAANLPPHSHSITASNATATSSVPTGLMAAIAPGPGANPPANFKQFLAPNAAGASKLTLAASTIQSSGTNVTINSAAPWVGITYLIATNGIYPTRP